MTAHSTSGNAPLSSALPLMTRTPPAQTLGERRLGARAHSGVQARGLNPNCIPIPRFKQRWPQPLSLATPIALPYPTPPSSATSLPSLASPYALPDCPPTDTTAQYYHDRHGCKRRVLCKPGHGNEVFYEDPAAVHVGRLAPIQDLDAYLYQLFSAYGRIHDLEITDLGKAYASGNILYFDPAHAKNAIAHEHGHELHGSAVTVQPRLALAKHVRRIDAQAFGGSWMVAFDPSMLTAATLMRSIGCTPAALDATCYPPHEQYVPTGNYPADPLFTPDSASFIPGLPHSTGSAYFFPGFSNGGLPPAAEANVGSPLLIPGAPPFLPPADHIGPHHAQLPFGLQTSSPMPYYQSSIPSGQAMLFPQEAFSPGLDCDMHNAYFPSLPGPPLAPPQFQEARQPLYPASEGYYWLGNVLHRVFERDIDGDGAIRPHDRANGDVTGTTSNRILVRIAEQRGQDGPGRTNLELIRIAPHDQLVAQEGTYSHYDNQAERQHMTFAPSNQPPLGVPSQHSLLFGEDGTLKHQNIGSSDHPGACNNDKPMAAQPMTAREQPPLSTSFFAPLAEG